MFKRVNLFIIFTIFTYADVHFAKLEPIDTITIKSEVNGKVIMAQEAKEGSVVNGVIVKIDDKLDKIDLKNSRSSLELIDKMIKINRELLPSLRKNMQKKLNMYKKVAPLASTSISQKDSLFSAFVSAKSQYNGVLEKVLNLENQKVTLSQKIATLNDRLSKKSIFVKNRYLYALSVKRGEYINIGKPIATVSNISRAKLTIYLSEDELKNIDKKSIYIDGKKTDLKFSKIWKIADSKYISSYRAEIILKPISRFSKLIKVEVK